MDDLTRFERQLADELDDMAGPGRDVDALALTRAVTERSTRPAFRSMFSASRVVLAGSLAALVVALVAIGLPSPPPRQQLVDVGASASPSARATVLPGLVTEQVEPGVLRIIRDDAGHDLDAGHPNHRLDLDGITITADGEIWLTTSPHDTDNQSGQAGPPFWALGRPGGFDPGAYLGEPVPLADGSILFVGDTHWLFDGTTFGIDRGPNVRPVPRGTLWLLEPADLMGLISGDAGAEVPARGLAVIWDREEGRWMTVSETQRSARSGHYTCAPTSSGVSCTDLLRGTDVRFLRGTRINQVAVAPDGAIWAVGSLDNAGGGLYRISLD